MQASIIFKPDQAMICIESVDRPIEVIFDGRTVLIEMDGVRRQLAWPNPQAQAEVVRRIMRSEESVFLAQFNEDGAVSSEHAVRVLSR